MLRKVKRKTNNSETYGSLNLLNAKDDHSLFKFHVMGDIQDGLPAHAFYHASTPVFFNTIFNTIPSLYFYSNFICFHLVTSALLILGTALRSDDCGGPLSTVKLSPCSTLAFLRADHLTPTMLLNPPSFPL